MNESSDKGEVEQRHLRWTSKQGHILTGGGTAETFYTPERGFSFESSELPHHYLIRKKSHETFKEWISSKSACSLVAGAWNRALFVGGWQNSTDAEERVYNVQTHNLFVDLRIPRSREVLLDCEKLSSLEDLNAKELRIYARQHIFAGFTVFQKAGNKPVCTRHHCIDWNFVGFPRSRPNKWWIDMNDDGTKWKENSYATDENGQYYYSERWERLGVAKEPRIALRRSSSYKRDGVFVLVGDHFNYILSRNLSSEEKEYSESSLVDLVDAAVASGDLVTARSYLSIEGGHGTVSSGWVLDCAIAPWKEGEKIWKQEDLEVVGETIDTCHILWKGEEWELYDCSFGDVDELCDFLMIKAAKHNKRQKIK